MKKTRRRDSVVVFCRWAEAGTAAVRVQASRRCGLIALVRPFRREGGRCDVNVDGGTWGEVQEMEKKKQKCKVQGEGAEVPRAEAAAKQKQSEPGTWKFGRQVPPRST